MPGIFVIDSGGEVRARLFEPDVRRRPSPEALIEAVRKLDDAPDE